MVVEVAKSSLKFTRSFACKCAKISRKPIFSKHDSVGEQLWLERVLLPQIRGQMVASTVLIPEEISIYFRLHNNENPLG